jgi:hypothetical protein
MSDDSTTVYLSEGALAQKQCYHTDPENCQSIADDEDTQETTKTVAEAELGLRICSHCDDSVDQDDDHDQRLNSIVKNADPDDGWAGVREMLADQEVGGGA